jgi:hypothetical protein
VNEKSVIRFLLKRMNLTSDMLMDVMMDYKDPILSARAYEVVEANKDIVEMMLPEEYKEFMVLEGIE